MPTPPQQRNSPGGTPEGAPTQAVLETVLFSDGELVGPGIGSPGSMDFDLMIFTAQRDSAVSIADTLLQGKRDPAKHDAAWEAITQASDSLRTYRGPAGNEPIFAEQLLWTKRHLGEAAAYDAAEYMLTVPTPWRKQR